jgi:hypothetical protein
MDKWTTRYKGWLLQCEPQRLADGRFDPRLVMQSYRGGETVEIDIKMKNAPIFESEEDAFEYALAKGKEQIDAGKA